MAFAADAPLNCCVQTGACVRADRFRGLKKYSPVFDKVLLTSPPAAVVVCSGHGFGRGKKQRRRRNIKNHAALLAVCKRGRASVSSMIQQSCLQVLHDTRLPRLRRNKGGCCSGSTENSGAIISCIAPARTLNLSFENKNSCDLGFAACCLPACCC